MNEQSLRKSSQDIHIEIVPDELDNVTSRGQRELSLADRDRNSVLARKVMAALQRIEYGDFGICSLCEVEMPEKRLKALPWAQYCISCQERHDKEQQEQKGWGVTLEAGD